MATKRTIALVALAAVAAIALAGCVPTKPMPTPTTSGSATPTPTPTPVLKLDPSGTAEDNLPYWDKTVYDIAVAYGLTIGENVVQQLVAAGFNKADMEITPNETAIGERVDSIIFSVRFKGECLIGQILPGDYSVSLAPMLGTGFCLVGTTRPIDF